MESDRPMCQVAGVLREMNDEEYAQYLKDVENHKKREKLMADQEKARQSALAKLAALGLTEDEIAAL